MALDSGTDGRRGLGALLRDLVEGSAELVRGEIRLARLEISGVAGAAGRGTGLIAVGGMLIVLGTLAVITGVVLFIGDQWLRDLYWTAALLVALIAGGVAAWLAQRGRDALSPSALAPHETVATLKEDTEWLKQQLTSGRTSS